MGASNPVSQDLTKPLVQQRNQSPRKARQEIPPPVPSPRVQALRDQNPSKNSPEIPPGRGRTQPGMGGSMDPFMTVNPQPMGPGTSVSLSPSGMQAKSPSPKGAVQAPPPPPPQRQMQGGKGGREMRPRGGLAPMVPNMEADRRQMQSQLAVMPNNTYNLSSANQVKQFNPASVLRGTGGLF